MEQFGKLNNLKIILFVICMLRMVAMYAVQITVDGVTYDDFGSAVIHEGLYRNVTVVGISNDFAGDLVIPALPAQFGDGLFYFRVTEIKSNVFRNNTKITSVTLPNTIAKISDWIFEDCTNLNKATIHSGIIDSHAFYGCTSLSSVVFGASVTNIGGFFGCPSLSQFEVVEENTVYSSLDGVLYNKNKTVIVNYPSGKTGASFSIPNTVLAIAESAFQGSSLSSIILPESLTSIGVWGIGDCPNLSSMVIPPNVTDISSSAFNLCTGLTRFDVAEANTAYSSSDGILYNKDKTVIVRYPPNKTNTSFSIPASVTDVYGYAFRDCLHLSSLFVSGNVSTIEYGAFAASKIQSITISKSVNFIDIYAFGWCVGLTDITVFWNTPLEVTINNGESSWDDIFADVDKSAVTLHVPPGTKATYLTSDIWKDFNIVDDATGITSVKAKGNIAVYYNSATDIVAITDLQGNEMLRFYNANGQWLFSHKATGDTEQIAVGHLPAGVYFVSTGSGQWKKWVKR